MKSQIKEIVERNFAVNAKYNYLFVKPFYAVLEKNLSPLEACILTYQLSKSGTIKCYRASSEMNMYKPVFTVENDTFQIGTETLEIKKLTPVKEVFCSLLTDLLVLEHNVDLSLAYQFAESKWDENPDDCSQKIQEFREKGYI